MRYREIGSSQLLQRKEHPPGHSVLTVSTLRQLWESATILSVSLNTLDPTRLSSHAYTAYLGRGVQQAEEKQPACLRSGELERQSWTAHGLRQLWQTEKQSKLPAVPVPHYSFFPSCLCLQAGNVTDTRLCLGEKDLRKLTRGNDLPVFMASRTIMQTLYFFKQLVRLNFYIQIHIYLELMATYRIREGP